MPNPTPTPPSQPSSTPATPAAQPQASKPVDPKTQVKAVVESVKTGEPTPATPKKYKVKVDNQEMEVDESTLVNDYQLRKLSDKKRSEAEKVLAEYKKLQEVSQKDPIKFMKAMGVDFDDLATKHLTRKAEEAMMDPKERELQQAKAEAEQYKKWVAEQKAKQEQTAKEAQIAQERSKIHSEIIQAIEETKDSLGLPVDEELVIAIAQKMLLQDKKQKPLNAKEALPKAYESQQKYLKAIAGKMEGEALVKWLGDDVAKKIRKYDLAQLKAKRAAAQPQQNALVKPKEDLKKPAPAYKTWSQFKKERLDTIQ